MTDALHTEMLQTAFIEVLAQERCISEINTQRITATTELDLQEHEAKNKMKAAWDEIATLMAESGEYEVEIPGAEINYKVSWSMPRKSVKVDDEAVPKEYCKEVLKPKLKEIKELLESGAQVNWARFEEGEKKLQWKAVKP